MQVGPVSQSTSCLTSPDHQHIQNYQSVHIDQGLGFCIFPAPRLRPGRPCLQKAVDYSLEVCFAGRLARLEVSILTTAQSVRSHPQPLTGRSDSAPIPYHPPTLHNPHAGYSIGKSKQEPQDSDTFARYQVYQRAAPSIPNKTMGTMTHICYPSYLGG
jgi:hypothetical protein